MYVEDRETVFPLEK